jgi:hypothetical protein
MKKKNTAEVKSKLSAEVCQSVKVEGVLKAGDYLVVALREFQGGCIPPVTEGLAPSCLGDSDLGEPQ